MFNGGHEGILSVSCINQPACSTGETLRFYTCGAVCDDLQWKVLNPLDQAVIIK